jgi:hypothetical protein
MRIKRLLELHQNYKSSETLSLNLGDSYLYEHNLIFRKIRQICVKNETNYSLEINTNYLALPLSQLNSILENKKIPYYDNVDVLKLVEKSIPDSTDWDEVVDNLKKNYLFHESCHFVARHLSEEFKQSQEQIIILFIEESFANACELIGIVYTHDAAHRIFYEANSYIFVLDAKPTLLKLTQQYGLPLTLTFLIYCYLFSNFLHNQLSEKDFQEIIQCVEDSY